MKQDIELIITVPNKAYQLRIKEVYQAGCGLIGIFDLGCTPITTASVRQPSARAKISVDVPGASAPLPVNYYVEIEDKDKVWAKGTARVHFVAERDLITMPMPALCLYRRGVDLISSAEMSIETETGDDFYYVGVQGQGVRMSFEEMMSSNFFGSKTKVDRSATDAVTASSAPMAEVGYARATSSDGMPIGQLPADYYSEELALLESMAITATRKF